VPVALFILEDQDRSWTEFFQGPPELSYE